MVTIYSLDVVLFLFGTSLFFHVEYIMRNAGLEETQIGIKIARRNINNIRYADDTAFMTEREELKSLDESERGEGKTWLKT